MVEPPSKPPDPSATRFQPATSRQTEHVERADDGGTVQPGTVLSHTYEIEALLARGGMGEVYRARHGELNTLHAIKIILPELANNAKVVDLFRREASVLRAVRHQAIVAYDGVFRDESGRVYLVMEFVEGPSLAQFIRKRPLAPDEVRLLRDRLAHGLAEAHEHGVIHRDLSPENVILEHGRLEQAKIIDFGIAKLEDPAAHTIVGKDFAGRYAYASPEQLGMFDGKVDARSDIYSLGLVLATAASGIPLDMGKSLIDVVRAREAVPDLSFVPAELVDELSWMLKPNPADRPQAMRDLLPHSVPPGAEGPHLSTGPTAPVRTSPPPRRGRTFLYGGIAAAAIVVAVGIGIVVTRPGDETPLTTAQPDIADDTAGVASAPEDSVASAEVDDTPPVADAAVDQNAPVPSTEEAPSTPREQVDAGADSPPPDRLETAEAPSESPALAERPALATEPISDEPDAVETADTADQAPPTEIPAAVETAVDEAPDVDPVVQEAEPQSVSGDGPPSPQVAETPDQPTADAPAVNTPTESAPEAAQPVASLQEPSLPQEVEPPEPEAPALTGAERREAQASLRRLGLYTGGIDGIFGPGTRAAISAFQRSIDEEATGTLTAEQFARLRIAAAAVPDPPPEPVAPPTTPPVEVAEPPPAGPTEPETDDPISTDLRSLVQGTGRITTLSQSELQQVTMRLRPCWSRQARGTGTSGSPVTVRVTAAADGTVTSAQVVGDVPQAVADAVVRAASDASCQPLFPAAGAARTYQIRLSGGFF